MRIAILSLAILTASSLTAQLSVDPSMTPDFYVQNVLLGGGVTVSNVTFNGNIGSMVDVNGQIGSFNSSLANVGINSGVILSSGNINVALGPNVDGGATDPANGFNGPGDPDMDVIAGVPTFDAAVLEFDFVPNGDSLLFNFVFASEEYLEFVNAGFNDPFGFFISGPGFAGPFTGGAENIALVPGSTTPVSIDNVNDITNNQYYIDNGDGFTAPFDSDPMYIQFDGLTTVLTAKAAVVCGQQYHIKLAIADAGDAILDSGVFLEGGSFSSAGTLAINVNTVSANGDLVEGCTAGELVVSRPDTIGDLVVNIDLLGTATNGVDYTMIPAPIIIPSGSTSVTFPISAFQDNTVEGTETIIFSTQYINGCGDTAFATATVDIVEYDPIVIVPDPALFLDCTQDSVPISALVSGGFGNLSSVWSNGATSNSTFVPGLQDGSYVITVTDDCGISNSASINVNAGCEIEIPNVFSPNADGLNDAFVIQGITGTKNVVRIYNRWGNLIYEKANYRNTWRAEGFSDGTYYYEVVVEGKPEPFTGHLTILR